MELTLGISRHRVEDNIKMDLISYVVWVYRLDSPGSV